MSQIQYTLDLLVEKCMLGCCLANTLVEFNAKLKNSNERVSADKEKYQCLVEKLIYLSHTKPDISYATSTISHFMQAPYEDHMEAINRIMRYL